jgi:D-inositol-3-phosphate glycosyltransferase
VRLHGERLDFRPSSDAGSIASDSGHKRCSSRRDCLDHRFRRNKVLELNHASLTQASAGVFRMPKIAIVSEHASPLAMAGGHDSGGQNVYVAHVAVGLARRGYAVEVFTRRDDASLPCIVDWRPDVRVVHLPAGPAEKISKEDLVPHMNEFSARLLDALEGASEPYDVIHANFFMSAWAALRPARMLELPLVTTFHALGRVRRAHQGEADRFPDERFEMEDAVVEGSDRIVAECAQDREDLMSLYGADPRKIAVIPCGFDPDEMVPMDRRAARESLRWNQDSFVVLQLGRLVARKGVDNAIRAIEELKRRYGIEAQLHIVGGETVQPDPVATPEIGRLSRLAQELGVSQQVQFAGRRDRHEISRYYSAADVFVTTPWYEPFGITPLEAMACGVPVIASAVGGLRTTVIDGRTGYLVPPKEPAALADRLALLQSNPAMGRILGKAGRRRAARLFTWSHVASGLMNVYASCIGSRARGSSSLAVPNELLA